MGLNVLGFVKCLSGKTKPILGEVYGKTSRIQQAVETFIEAERSSRPTTICHVTQRTKNKAGETIFANMKESTFGTTFSDYLRMFYKK